MAFAFQHAFFLLAFFSIFLVNPSLCFNTHIQKLLNASDSASNSGWEQGKATWYGSPEGAGSDGGACGYGGAVEGPPYNKLITAMGPASFASGQGCGACYQVKCTAYSQCSGNPVKVYVTDECPGCETQGIVHLDLSGHAFGGMARSGQEQQLRNVGIAQIQYQSVSCDSLGKLLAFHVDSGSDETHFASLIEFENGESDITKVELKEAVDSDSWLNMQQSWGAVWKLDASLPLKAPFSIRLTYRSGESIVADGVIPAGWKPGRTYRSFVNF